MNKVPKETQWVNNPAQNTCKAPARSIPVSASLKGSGNCSARTLYYTHWQVNQLMQALPSKSILGSAYWWMVTGNDMVNTGITKTSSLFQEKQSGAWHGPGRELMGREFHMAGLLWFLGRHWAKDHPYCHGCTIYTKMCAGDDICSDITLHMQFTGSLAWHILRHILDNACWHQKMCPRPITANYAIYGP